MAVTAAGSPYVESSDLVANYPGASLSLANRVDQVMQAPTQNAQTGTTYTAALLDAGKTVTLSNAAAVTLTIPAQATVAWVANTQLNFLNIGVGTVTITPAATVTINGTPLTLATSKGGSLVRTASNTWTFIPTGAGGKVLQVVNVQTGAVATGSTAIPQDDTIPQITEGDQYMSLAITPSNVSNILIIEVVAQMSVAAERNMTLALFNGATNAIGAVNEYYVASTAAPMGFNVTQTAGTTSVITFTVRAGNSAGTTSTLNGIAGTRFYGGVSASSITITEYTP